MIAPALLLWPQAAPPEFAAPAEESELCALSGKALEPGQEIDDLTTRLTPHGVVALPGLGRRR